MTAGSYGRKRWHARGVLAVVLVLIPETLKAQNTKLQTETTDPHPEPGSLNPYLPRIYHIRNKGPYFQVHKDKGKEYKGTNQGPFL